MSCLALWVVCREFYGLTDYPEIIKKPMDLGTIQVRAQVASNEPFNMFLAVQKKLEEGKYNTPDKFAADVRLVWKNAMTYNRPDSDIYSTADKLSKVFERKFAKIKGANKPPGAGAPGAGAGAGAGSAAAAGVKR